MHELVLGESINQIGLERLKACSGPGTSSTLDPTCRTQSRSALVSSKRVSCNHFFHSSEFLYSFISSCCPSSTLVTEYTRIRDLFFGITTLTGGPSYWGVLTCMCKWACWSSTSLASAFTLEPFSDCLGGISLVHVLTRSTPYLRATNLDAIPLTSLTSCFPSVDLANFCLLKDIVKSFQRS